MMLTKTRKNISNACRAGITAFIFCVTMQAPLHAQRVTPPATPAPRVDTAAARIEEQLVALAINSPRIQAAIRQGKINEYQLKAARNNWVNLLTLSYNYNDLSFARTATPIVYPKFFIGVNVPLGTLLSRTGVKAANESVEINKLNVEELRRSVRADVIGKYRQYRSYNELIILQRELVDDLQAALLQAEDRFRKGTLTIESFNTAQRSKNEEVAKLINLQLQQELIKLDIEEMIGTFLESVTG